MSNPKKQNGLALLAIIAIIAVLGLGGAWALPKIYHGDTSRAKQSTEATADLLDKQNKQGATAAAKITTVKEVAETLPDSREKEFIGRETESALGDLPKPDPDARLKSIERKLAVLSGDVSKVASLYEKDHENSLKLQKELDQAVTERKAVDEKLTIVAAERKGAETQRNVAIVFVVLLGAGVAYLKIFGISRATGGRMLADMRAGMDPVQAFDTHLAPWMHAGVNKASRLATPHED